MSELPSPAPAPPAAPASSHGLMPRNTRSSGNVTEPASLEGTCADTLGLVVAPTTGRFQPAATNGRVTAGQLIGHITGGRGRADEVRTPVDARLKNLLVRPRQLVRRGQALAWLEVSSA